jgi:alpha-glucosidase (family GH31 glycosyl hydrolase)
MISDLRADGFKTIAIIDPGIKVDPEYKVYQGNGKTISVNGQTVLMKI